MESGSRDEEEWAFWKAPSSFWRRWIGEAPRRGGDIVLCCGRMSLEAVIVCDVLALLGVLDVDSKWERAVWKEVVLGADVDARIATINNSQRYGVYR